ncbi:purine and uridine phosphorylase [Aspergillus unguis]
MSPRDQFKTAIICALPEETSAVEECLDETYDKFSHKYGKQRNDPNVYINGRMGQTKVVICQGPWAGKVGAAGVVSSLRLSYTELKLVLVVGICGGLPSQPTERERSLGDVIISDSIIEYDFGKRYSGEFERKAIAKTHDREISILLENLKMKNFGAEFEAKLAGHLRKLQLVDHEWWHPRAQRGVKIHIGRIASADTIMMSEVHRDEVAAAEGVIGFESEGSGVWDHTTPCIIIKGMSYYADRRNNDRWRNYAAATGASAAKTLLVDYWKPASEFRTNHWIVPFQRNECFTGRQQEIKQLDDEITSPNGPRRQAILGLGGIGKTQVALELAYQLRHKDPDYPVFWIPCTSIEMIEQSYINITRILGLEEDSAGSGGMKERLKTYLSQNVTKWLLVLDNVDDSRVWRYVKDALPQSEEGRILITSRSRKVAAESAFSNILRISEPNEEAALGMLKNKLADKSLLQDESATSALLERLAYLPLAITQAAAYLNWNEKYTVSKYLELLDKHESQAMDLLSTDFADEGRYTDKPNPVSSTWFVSFNQIMDLSELAIHYLRLMACVSRHDIPDRFLPSKTSEKEKLDALGLLGAFSFVTANHETGSSTMHRLVRLVTRNWMRQNEQFDEYLAKAANGVWEAMPRRNEDKRLLRQTYLPHAMSILNEKDLKKEDHFHLIWRVAHALSDDRRFKEALPLFIDALDLRQRYLGKESPAAISSMADLASTYRNLSQLEKAEEIAVQALEMSKRILDEDDPELMFNTINLAFIYKLQGRWSEAEILDQEAIKVRVREDVLGPRSPQVLENMHALAAVYNNRGAKADAKQIMARAVELAKDTFGSDDPRTKRYALFLTEIEGEAVRAVTPTEIRPGAQSTAETNRRRDRLISKNLFAKAWKAVRG